MNAKSEYVQLEASKDILDRGGYGKEQPLLNLNGQDMKILIDLGWNIKIAWNLILSLELWVAPLKDKNLVGSQARISYSLF